MLFSLFGVTTFIFGSSSSDNKARMVEIREREKTEREKIEK